MQTGSWSGTASSKDIRESFLRKAGAKGISATQHGGKLTLGGEKIRHGNVRMKDSVDLMSQAGEKNLTKAARTYVKKRGFKKVGSRPFGRNKKSSVYQDKHGNEMELQSGWLQGQDRVTFTTGGKGMKV